MSRQCGEICRAQVGRSARHFLAWGLERKIELVHIEPGRPVQNAYVESFHGELRDECLNASWLANLSEARAKIGAWKEENNEARRHSSLRYLAPREFASPSCGAAVAYGSLRATTRRTGGGKSHEFRRSWCRMIPCTELGAGQPVVKRASV
jgi:Integrase core domain